MMRWYFKVITNYAVFKGRARRREYWLFRLFDTIFFYAIVFLDSFLSEISEHWMFGVITILYLIATILPHLAVSARRMHDIDKSGWWLMVYFIPIIGKVWLFILLVTESQSGENEYGPNPIGIANLYG